MKKNLWIAVVAVAAVLVAAYFLVPGFRRTATQTWTEMSEAELRENWEFYYDEAISNLKAKLATTFEKQVDLRVTRAKSEKELEKQRALVEETSQLGRSFAGAFKALGGDPSPPVKVLNWTYDSVAEARDQLLRFARDATREAGRLQGLAERHDLLFKAQTEHMQLVDQLKSRIRELEEQKDDMKANIEVAKIRRDLAALTDLDRSLSKDPDIKQLQRIKSVIDEKVLRDEVVATLHQEDARMEQQSLSARQALEQMRGVASDSEAEALVEEWMK